MVGWFRSGSHRSRQQNLTTNICLQTKQFNSSSLSKSKHKYASCNQFRTPQVGKIMVWSQKMGQWHIPPGSPKWQHSHLLHFTISQDHWPSLFLAWEILTIWCLHRARTLKHTKCSMVEGGTAAVPACSPPYVCPMAELNFQHQSQLQGRRINIWSWSNSKIIMSGGKVAETKSKSLKLFC